MAQVLEPPIWETQVEFQDPDYNLICSGLLQPFKELIAK